jgi:hypothetical protein
VLCSSAAASPALRAGLLCRSKVRGAKDADLVATLDGVDGFGRIWGRSCLGKIPGRRSPWSEAPSVAEF